MNMFTAYRGGSVRTRIVLVIAGLLGVIDELLLVVTLGSIEGDLSFLWMISEPAKRLAGEEDEQP